MEIYPKYNDPNREKTLREWKNNPIIIRELCSNCKSGSTLVQLLQGGLVKWKCSNCNKLENLTNKYFYDELEIGLQCPICHQKLNNKTILRNKNYAFICKNCHIAIQLADLIPNE